MDEEDDFLGGKGKKQKRGVLPKHATSVMRSWLFQHLVVSFFFFGGGGNRKMYNRGQPRKAETSFL